MLSKIYLIALKKLKNKKHIINKYKINATQ